MLTLATFVAAGTALTMTSRMITAAAAAPTTTGRPPDRKASL